MKYNDPRIKKMSLLLDKMIDEGRKIDRRTPEVYASAQAMGTIKYLMDALYSSIPEDSHMADHIFIVMENRIEEMGEREVMTKLES